MKIAIERYFNSFNDLLDETNYLLTDWTTPEIVGWVLVGPDQNENIDFLSL